MNDNQKLLLTAADNLASVSKKLIEATQYLAAASEAISRLIILQDVNK